MTASVAAGSTKDPAFGFTIKLRSFDTRYSQRKQEMETLLRIIHTGFLSMQLIVKQMQWIVKKCSILSRKCSISSRNVVVRQENVVFHQEMQWFVKKCSISSRNVVVLQIGLTYCDYCVQHTQSNLCQDKRRTHFFCAWASLHVGV